MSKEQKRDDGPQSGTSGYRGNSLGGKYQGEFGGVVDGSSGTPLDPKGGGYPGDRKPRIGGGSGISKENPRGPVAEDPETGKPIINDQPSRTAFPKSLNERGYGTPSPATSGKDAQGLR